MKKKENYEAAPEGVGLEAEEGDGEAGRDHGDGHQAGRQRAGEERAGDGQHTEDDQQEAGKRAETGFGPHRAGHDGRGLGFPGNDVVICVVHDVAPFFRLMVDSNNG